MYYAVDMLDGPTGDNGESPQDVLEGWCAHDQGDTIVELDDGVFAVRTISGEFTDIYAIPEKYLTPKSRAILEAMETDVNSS